jgi:hypothetical protein
VFSNETSVGIITPTFLEKPQFIKKKKKKLNAAYGHECFHALNCMQALAGRQG